MTPRIAKKLTNFQKGILSKKRQSVVGKLVRWGRELPFYEKDEDGYFHKKYHVICLDSWSLVVGLEFVDIIGYHVEHYAFIYQILQGESFLYVIPETEPIIYAET